MKIKKRDNAMKKKIVLYLWFVTALFVFPNFLAGQQKEPKQFPTPQIPFHPRTYVCYRTPSPLNIDGKLQERAWKKAHWTKYFVDIRGAHGPKPRFQTRVKMLWDDRYFYVAAHLEEPNVWATLKKRDSVIYHDNDFEVFIDPDGDTQDYYEFEMNALNTVWDLLLTRPYRDKGDAVTDWDIHGLKSAVQVRGTLNQPGDRDKGWTVEIAFPWAALAECAHKQAPPHGGEQWRVNFSRVEWRVEVKNGRYEKVKDPKTGKPLPEDNWVWSPQGLINMHYPEMWGIVQFSEKEVGKGKEAYEEEVNTEIFWQMRRVYYAERSYFLNHGRFTSKVSLTFPKIPGVQFPPSIVAGRHFFVAVLRNVFDDQHWYIREDGKVWYERN